MKTRKLIAALTLGVITALGGISVAAAADSASADISYHAGGKKTGDLGWWP